MVLSQSVVLLLVTSHGSEKWSYLWSIIYFVRFYFNCVGTGRRSSQEVHRDIDDLYLPDS